jgi:NAD(P)-dependent dehydrogenase (short-subunit alcohol dehydrogenase family)
MKINLSGKIAIFTGSTAGIGFAIARGLAATWTLSRPEQEQVGIPPVTLEAFFGHGFHHPHLRGATVAFRPAHLLAGTLLIPYLVRVAFSSSLTCAVWQENPAKVRRAAS